MSRYAWLVCEDSKQVIWLGKMCIDPLSGQPYFHIGEANSPANSSNTLLTKAIMKLLATNVGKTLRVWSEEMFDTSIDERFTIIGGDGDNSIPMDRFIENYPG